MVDAMIPATSQSGSGTVSPSGRLDWERDGAYWPNRAASRFVEAGGMNWHVQCMGESGPRMLLLHGTAASTHSWSKLAPILARDFQIVAPDLPGHAFTTPAAGPRMSTQAVMSLSGMARGVTALIDQLKFQPDIVVGHSAGAAILVRMCLDKTISPKVIVSLNGALLPFGSVGRYVLPAMARLLFQNSFVPWVFARQARGRGNVERLIRGTGSDLTEADMDFYVRLFQSKAHVEAALAMMANWDLQNLESDLPKLTTPLAMVAASEDLAVPPEKAVDVKRMVANGSVEYVRGLGHLAHEEDPARIARLIVDIARRQGALVPDSD